MTQRAGIYGGSLYELAKEEGLDKKIFDELTQIMMLFRENPDYITLLLEPSIKKEKRLEMIEEAFGESCERYLVNFLKLMCERDLLREFEGCREAYKQRYYADHNISEALITSAVKLSDEQIDSLREKLEKQSGKTIIIDTKIDTSVIGGIRAELDGKRYDGTVAGRLESMHRMLDETII